MPVTHQSQNFIKHLSLQGFLVCLKGSPCLKALMDFRQQKLFATRGVLPAVSGLVQWTLSCVQITSQKALQLAVMEDLNLKPITKNEKRAQGWILCSSSS